VGAAHFGIEKEPMLILYIITAVLLVMSAAASPGKTGRALQIALSRFLGIVPAFAVMLVLVAVALYLVPNDLMVKILARENKWVAMASATGLGSVSIMPGFIAFPLCGILRDKGALYMVLSAFSTTLMLVGVASFPMEKAYLGARLALLRNLAGLGIAIAVALATGLYFGELP
jgi:uncharacterized membrane protein YraQ (UPF0718 family)